MQKINFKSNKFVVIGAGDTGVSIIKFLQYHNADILRVLDTRDSPPPIFNPIIGGEITYQLLEDADVIVISPGVSIYEPALQQALHLGKHVVGDIELFAQNIMHWGAKLIGITGSNGKTTVTSLTGHLAESVGLKTLVAGNIGTAVLNAWLACESTRDYPQVVVLELSSFQLETTYSLNLDSATVLNISEDHLDRYRDLLEYAYVKANIFNNCKVQVLNKADLLVLAMKRENIQCNYFSEINADYSLSIENKQTYLIYNQHKILNCDELQLVGRHNYLNALASIALLHAIGLNIESLVAGLKSFAGLEHRMQKVMLHNGVLYIEDSKGTNVGAVIAGVSGIDRPVHLILGGDGKGQDFMPLRGLVLAKCKSVAIIGADKHKIGAILKDINIPQLICESLKDAVDFCMNNAIGGDAVILSPACASWDMFDNYKHRAQIFVESVYENIK